MDKIDNHGLNPFEWAQAEFKAEPSYWKDRAEHGNGLIRDIANFVLKAGGEQR